jgi:hypothetical protein
MQAYGTQNSGSILSAGTIFFTTFMLPRSKCRCPICYKLIGASNRSSQFLVRGLLNSNKAGAHCLLATPVAAADYSASG